MRGRWTSAGWVLIAGSLTACNARPCGGCEHDGGSPIADSGRDGSGPAAPNASTHDASSPPPDASAADGGADAVMADAGSASVSGEPLPAGDLPHFHQIFTDDFSTDVPLGHFPDDVSDRWGAYPSPWHDTSGNGTYDPERVISVHDGVMTLHLHTESGTHLVSAPYPRIHPGSTGNGQLYGRYAVRFRADAVPGYKTAWLLWPDSGMWPQDGEIDFPEGNLTGTISAFMHRQDGTSGSDQDAYPTSTTYTSWHTAVLEWTPAVTRFLLDGTVIGTSTARIPDTSMHWVIQTETQLSGGPPSDTAAGDVVIDWVAVWSYVP